MLIFLRAEMVGKKQDVQDIKQLPNKCIKNQYRFGNGKHEYMYSDE